MSADRVPSGRLALCALAASVLALALYARTLGHAFVDVDVAPYVTQNEAVLAGLTWKGVGWAFTSFHAANWHPLTWLSHMLDVELFALAPAGHHAHNAVLHALASALVVVVLARATGALGPSWFCGLAFAAHPLHVESVAWIAERKDVLSGALGLAALLAWLGWAQRGSCRAWWSALALFALALMAKPMLVTLPFALLLLDAWPLRRTGLGWRALVREKLPFLALSVASSVLTVLAQRAGGAVQDLERLPFAARATNAAVAYATYLRRAFWPTDLSFYYPLPSDGHAAATTVVSIAVVVAVGALAWRVRRHLPAVSVGVALFLGMLVPAIGLVQVGGQALADRYMYLPLLGILVAAAWTAHALLALRWLRISIGAAAIAALGAVATRQIRTWGDSESLAERALAVTAGNHVAHNLLGYALGRRGERHAALEQFDAALAIEPGDLEARDNRAVLLFQLDRAEEAEGELRSVLAANPSMAKAREHLGAVLLARGEAREAREHLIEAVRLAPGSPGAHANLGEALERLGDREGARAQLLRTLQLAPDDLRGLIGLARLEIDAGSLDAAAARLERALALQPESPQARQQRARIRVLRGDEHGAAEDLRAAIAARPGWALPRIDLAWLLASARDGAVRDAQAALAIAEEIAQAGARRSAAALDALALAQAALGRFEDASRSAEQARDRAQQSGETELAARIARRLDAYRQRRIDRETPR